MEDKKWRTIRKTYLHKSPYFSFRLDEVSLPDGANIEYGVLESGGFAAVLPVTDEGNVVLVRQWRHPLGRFALELPSGAVDAGEEPGEAARRELFEETGYRAEGIEHLATVHTSPGRSDEICHVFRCRAVKDGKGPRPEPTEFIEVVEMPMEEAMEEARSGEVSDAASVLGFSLGCR